MRRIIFFIFIQTFLFSKAHSQTFMHGVGLGVYGTDFPQGDDGVYAAFSYSPRVNFVETEALSVSAGIPFSIGFSGNYAAGYSSTYGTYEENSVRFMFNAPLIFNLNVGAGSTKENEKRIGFFVGAGFGYHYSDLGWQTDEFGISLTQNIIAVRTVQPAMQVSGLQWGGIRKISKQDFHS